MKKIILLIICALSFAGCTLEYDYEPGPTDPGYTPSVYIEYEVPVGARYYYEDVCWDDPYWHTEEWCDYYDDGSLCCVWYVDGFGEYEEWCQWDYDWCWEYNGSF